MLNDTVQFMLFSATLNRNTLNKFEYLLKEPDIEFIDCNEEHSLLNKNIDEFKVLLDENDKMLLLVSLFKLNILPLKVLIFTNSVEKC